MKYYLIDRKRPFRSTYIVRIDGENAKVLLQQSHYQEKRWHKVEYGLAMSKIDDDATEITKEVADIMESLWQHDTF